MVGDDTIACLCDESVSHSSFGSVCASCFFSSQASSLRIFNSTIRHDVILNAGFFAVLLLVSARKPPNTNADRLFLAGDGWTTRSLH